MSEESSAAMSHEPPDPFVELQRETLRERDSTIVRLRTALEWYADKLNYKSFAVGNEWMASIETDQGLRARLALKGEDP